MPVNDALLHGWFYGNFYVRVTAAVGFAFLMGSIPVGPVVRWLFADLDPRLARGANALVAPLDALKAFIPVAIAGHGGGIVVGCASGAASVLGDCFAPWRRPGGSGVATEAGVLLALCWPAGAIFVLMWGVAAASSNLAAVGSLVASVFAVVSLWFFFGPYAALFALFVFLVVASRHGASFTAIAEAREPHLFPSVVRADRQPVEGV